MPRSKDFLNEVNRVSYHPSTPRNLCFDDPDIENFYEITIIEEGNGKKYKKYLPKGKKGWQPLTITEETTEGEKVIYSKMTHVGSEQLLKDYLLSQPETDERQELLRLLSIYAPDHP